MYCNAWSKILSSFPNQGAQSKLPFLPTPQGIPILLSEHKARHWQKRELRAWQLKDEERENTMCSKSGTHKIIMAGHIILTLFGIVCTLMIFQHVMNAESWWHRDRKHISDDKWKGHIMIVALQSAGETLLCWSPLFSCWKTCLPRNWEKLLEQFR